MVAAIKEICIFVIIAQAIMFFVPGNAYMKYVRVLVGIMMILKITEPIFGLFLDEEKEREIAERILLLEQNIDIESEALEAEDKDNSMGIYESIEEELKNRLNECECGYEVLDVSLTGEQKLLVTLKEEEKEAAEAIRIEAVEIGGSKAYGEGPGEEKEQELKELFQSCIGVDAGRIEIVFD